MNVRATALLLLCLAGIASGADPTASPSPAPAASPSQAAAGPVVLDSIAAMDLRATTLASFVAGNPNNGFHWLSTAHDSAENTRPGLTLFQIPTSDVVVRFAAGNVGEIVVSFYNRGDSGQLSKDDFDGLIAKCAHALTDFTKVQPSARGKDPANAVKIDGVVWQTDKARFLLESSFSKTPQTGFRAEFVRLTITAPEKPKTLIEESLATMLPGQKFSGATHVKTLPNGDVLIQGIPMVDQGEKGYCVVATAERVLRYYGDKVDENELAAIANSSAKEGTSPPAMLNALKRISDRLHVKTRILEKFDGERFTAMFDEYNRFAAHGNRAKQLDLHVDELIQIFEQMDPDVLLDARTKNPSEMNRFFRTAQTRINDGVPPLWSVMIGLYPHGKTADEYGGHTRLIIGYNPKTNEVLYSDPWGYGHELSRMPLATAWSMTIGLNSIEPLD